MRAALSEGLNGVNRQMAKILIVNRQKWNIFILNRQMSEPKLGVKFLRYPQISTVKNGILGSLRSYYGNADDNVD